MADADRLVAALNYLQEQKPADPLESFRSLAGLKDAYERRVQPIINNAMQTFSTGGAMGDLLRSYGDAAAPGNAAALKGMGIPFKGPITAPREEGVSSGENFRPMGDPQQQFAGQLLGDPMNVQPMVAPAARGAVAAGKYAGPELARGLENYMGKAGLITNIKPTNKLSLTENLFYKGQDIKETLDVLDLLGKGIDKDVIYAALLRDKNVLLKDRVNTRLAEIDDFNFERSLEAERAKNPDMKLYPELKTNKNDLDEWHKKLNAFGINYPKDID
jgi:hypothetical protein